MTAIDVADELTARYIARTSALATASGGALARAWDQLGSYDEADIPRLEALAAEPVEVYAAQAAAVSAAYLSLLLDEPPIAATRTVAPDWRGAFTHHWGALAAGEPWETALDAGRARAAAAGQQAAISTARRVGDQLESDRITGWRRTLSSNPCQWCIDVATQTYESAESADFGHDRCHCGVTPVLR